VPHDLGDVLDKLGLTLPLKFAREE
jgi:hypothetical protein